MVLYNYSRDLEEDAIDDIYNLRRRKGILPENIDELQDIERISDNEYAIYDHNGRHVLTLLLP